MDSFALLLRIKILLPSIVIRSQISCDIFWVVYFDLVLYIFLSLRHAHYQAGITPLALVWKDENCSQYVMDTDSKGQVPNQQQVFSLSSLAFSHFFCF